MPSIYKLELGLPLPIDTSSTKSYFDCKLRKLIVVMRPMSKSKQVNASAAAVDIIVDTKQLESDLLFDVI